MDTAEIYHCETCPRIFGARREFNQHLKTHSKPYACKKCVAKFALRSDLNRHDRARHQLGQSRFPCYVDGCAFKATRKDNLKQHVAKKHSNDGATYRRQKEQERHNNDPVATMMYASSAGNIRLLQATIQWGACVNAKADDGSTALHCAVKTAQYDMIRYLLSIGACTEVLNDNHRTPLLEATYDGDEQSFALLIKHGAEITQAILTEMVVKDVPAWFQLSFDHYGSSCLETLNPNLLRLMVTWKRNAMMQVILNSPFVTREWTSMNFHLAAHEAVWENDSVMLMLMLESGKVDPNIRCKSYQSLSLLHVAVTRGYTSMVEILLNCPDIRVDEQDAQGRTPFETSVLEGSSEIVQLLLYHHATNAGEPRELLPWPKHTKPLHEAIRRHHYEVTKVLLEHSQINVNERDYRHETPLESAIFYSSHEIVGLLLIHEEIDLSIPTRYNESILTFAMARKQWNILRQLIHHVDAGRGTHGPSGSSVLTSLMFEIPLHISGYVLGITESQVETEDDIRLNDLKECIPPFGDFDLSSTNASGHSLIHLAAIKNYAHIVKLLVARFALRVNLQDNMGRTALQLAVEHGSHDAIRALLKHDRVEVLTKDVDGLTTLETAAIQGDLEAVLLILENRSLPEDNLARAIVLANRHGHESVAKALREEERKAIDRHIL